MRAFFVLLPLLGHASCMDLAATSRPEKQVSCLLQIDSKSHISQVKALRQQPTEGAWPQAAGPAADPAAQQLQQDAEAMLAAQHRDDGDILRDQWGNEISAYGATDQWGNIVYPGNPYHRQQGDPHLDRLQEWFRQALPEPVAAWNSKQEQNFKPDTELVQQKSDGQPWGKACKAHGFAAQPGPIAKQFHFVLFEERGAWINSTHPYKLISVESAAYQSLTQVEQVLIENVRNTVVMNDAASVRFMDTAACESATGAFSPELLAIYRGEADLRYRADVCRIAALYWEGGYYFDDDMVAYRPIVPLIHEDTEFATVQAVEAGLFFQSFIAATPCHPVLRRNLEMFIEARMPNPPKKYENLLGPVTLKLAFKELLPSNSQIFTESRYNPVLMTEPLMVLPSYNGFECEFIVYDRVTKELLFCSRI